MWYLTDNIGSVRENVNTSGTVLDSITYDSYGNIKTESSPSSGDRFKYASREWDSEIGQYYYRARNYNAAIGRFENEDQVGFRGGDTNLYRYVKNAPVISVDPTGEGRPYPVSPADPECLRLWQRILNISADIKKRVDLIKENPLKLPFFKPGAPNRESQAGHIVIVADLMGALAVRIAEYWWKCTNRPPLEPPPPVPVPEAPLKPVPIPIPVIPDIVPVPRPAPIKPEPIIIGGAIVLGVALMFVPGVQPLGAGLVAVGVAGIMVNPTSANAATGSPERPRRFLPLPRGIRPQQ
jgi:RHS repeat-associated protein